MVLSLINLIFAIKELKVKNKGLSLINLKFFKLGLAEKSNLFSAFSSLSKIGFFNPLFIS